MAEGGIRHEANPSDHLRKQGVALKRVRARGLAGVDIRFAGVTGGIYDEFRFNLAKVVKQNIELGVIEGTAGQRHERSAAAAQFTSERLTDVTG